MDAVLVGWTGASPGERHGACEDGPAAAGEGEEVAGPPMAEKVGESVRTSVPFVEHRTGGV